MSRRVIGQRIFPSCRVLAMSKPTDNAAQADAITLKGRDGNKTMEGSISPSVFFARMVDESAATQAAGLRLLASAVFHRNGSCKLPEKFGLDDLIKEIASAKGANARMRVSKADIAKAVELVAAAKAMGKDLSMADATQRAFTKRVAIAKAQADLAAKMQAEL